MRDLLFVKCLELLNQLFGLQTVICLRLVDHLQINTFDLGSLLIYSPVSYTQTVHVDERAVVFQHGFIPDSFPIELGYVRSLLFDSVPRKVISQRSVTKPTMLFHLLTSKEAQREVDVVHS